MIEVLCNVLGEKVSWRVTSSAVEDVVRLGFSTGGFRSFAAGYSYYEQKNYRQALVHLKAALERKGSSPAELADLQFFTAFCDSSLAESQTDKTPLNEAIDLYENAGKIYEGRRDETAWARTQNNLAIAYSGLSTGDRIANVQKAIEIFQGVLRVITEKDFPVDWAKTQYNLGVAYRDLRTGITRQTRKSQ